MIRRRIEGLYGSGAARIALCSEAFHVGDPDDSLHRAGELFVDDLRELGLRRALGLGGAPVVAVVLLVMYLAASALFRPVDEASDIELVPFEVARVVPPPPAALELPSEPAPVPEPLEAARPAPPPAVPKPEPVAKPVPPSIVPPRSAKPPPERKLRREPAPAPRPAPEPPPRARPRMEIDRLAAAPPPQAPEAARRQRAARDRADVALPRVAVAPLSAARAPSPAAAEPRARQRFRVAASATSASAPTVRVDAMPASPHRVAVEPTRTQRQRVAPAPRRQPPAARPELAVAASQRLPAGQPPPRPGRAARIAATPKPARRPPAVDVAGLGAMASRAPSGAQSPGRVRTAAATAPQGPGRRQSPDEKLRGVALGSLAACRSDADEDSLKQRVVAAVTTQKECLSGAGHYRFLQTGNLNSFLMWVERASGRGEADRCVELRHALECLKRQVRTES